MQTSKPFISVVIPTYNRALLIGKTLNCLLAQTYNHFEVIIVDNCSTDNTAEILVPYLKDRRFQYICNSSNRERSFSRNVGMKVAKGDWLTFLDSDDLLMPNCFADAAMFSQNHDFQLFHNLYDLRDTSDHILYKYKFPPLADSKAHITDGNFLSCIGVFLHRDVYTKFQFDENPELTGTEDWDFFLRLLAVYPLGRIESVNSSIIDHSQRTLKDANLAKAILSKKQIVINKVETDSELNRVYGSYIPRMYASATLYSANLNLTNSNFRGAILDLIAAVKYYPRILVTRRFYSLLSRLFRGS